MNDPETAKRLFFEALDFFDAADFANAESRLREALTFAPANASILTNLATAAVRQSKFAEAREFSERALAANQTNVEALMVLATCLTRDEHFADALAAYDRIIALEPRIAEVHSNRAHALNGLERYAEALASCDSAIALQPSLADAYINRGNALVRLARHAEALEAFDAALRLKPALAEASLGRGNALFGLKSYDEAIAAYDLAIAARADLAAAWLGRAWALMDTFRFDEAAAALDRASAINPDLPRAWLGRGNIFRHRRQLAQAHAAYEKALALDPRLAEAWQARGAAFADAGRFADALPAIDRAFELRPELPYLATFRLNVRMWLGDWNGFDEECARLLAALRAGAPVIEPMTLLPISSSGADQLACGRLFAAQNFPASPPPVFAGSAAVRERLRVAYVSPDFRDHPVSFLTAGLFEEHDKSRFDILAIALSADEPSDMRARIRRAATEFIEVGDRSDDDIVGLLRERRIDVAVDLAGYTLGGRPSLFASRVAPIQVSHLGFPATTGAPFFDYILADRVVIPSDAREQYAERVVHLPDCFQPNDARRRISERTPARSEVGLPDDAFVFCVFHSSYKLNPQMFGVWMRLLQEVRGSVLWLVGDNPPIVRNLRREADARGVDAARLVFAPRVPYADHLARHRLADLFLDTFPFNGGTTTSDALWAGLPVVTLSGEAFAARMSASLLGAVGLPELAVQTPAEYESLALRLARDRGLLGDVKARLAANRATHPLFDTRRYARHIEAAYAEMWGRHRGGAPPDGFSVRAID
jgi:predicted O-linked N-acetylglucosamine transferase (SPINDLY family)